MGIGTLGFQKGFAKSLYDSIDARDQAEIELKKQKDLEKFRADYRQQLEMKEATTFQTLKKDDGTYETVGFNKQNERINSRAATSAEVKSLEDAARDRADTLDKRERDKRRDDQVYKYADEDQDMQRKTHAAELAYKAAATAASNRSNRGSSLDGSGASGGKQNLSTVLDTIMTRNKSAIEELSGQEGVPLSSIQDGAWRWAEQRLAAGDSPLDLERNFTSYLRELRFSAQRQGNRLDRYKKPATEGSSSFRKD